MNRRSKWVLGATVALITVASLRFTVGPPHWHHGYHHGQNHPQCEGRWQDHGEKNHEKPQAEPPKNQ